MSLLRGIADRLPARSPVAAPAAGERAAAGLIASPGLDWSRLLDGARGPDDPIYDFRLAMSAPAYFPWLRVGVVKAASMLAGLPLLDDSGEPFQGADTVDRAMWWASLMLCEESWARAPTIAGDRFLHPADGIVRQGAPVGFRASVDGSSGPAGTEVLAPVVWHRGLTFASRENHRGTSAIRALQSVLNTEINVDRHAANSARRGAVSMFASPKDSNSFMGTEQRTRLREDFENQRTQGFDMLILPTAMDVRAAQLSARDMEFSQVVARAQSAALAVMNVPPTLAGLPSANYGTARAEERSFWEFYRNVSGTDDPTSGMNGFLSRVYGRRVRHDFSQVSALRVVYADMAATAAKFLAFGMSPRDALRAAGFGPAVYSLAGDTPAAQPEGRPNRPASVDSPRERVARALEGAAERWHAGATDEDLEARLLAAELRACGIETADAEHRAARHARTQALGVRVAQAGGADVRQIRAFEVGDLLGG